MSNCHLVAGRSLIDLAASRLALRAPALRAATALTRPNRSAQRLPCGRHAVPTTKTVRPSDVVANHRIKCRDHLPHHRHDHDLRQFAGAFQTIVKEFERRIPIAGAHRGHVEHLADVCTTAPDTASALGGNNCPLTAISRILIFGLPMRSASGPFAVVAAHEFPRLCSLATLVRRHAVFKNPYIGSPDADIFTSRTTANAVFSIAIGQSFETTAQTAWRPVCTPPGLQSCPWV